MATESSSSSCSSSSSSSYWLRPLRQKGDRQVQSNKKRHNFGELGRVDDDDVRPGKRQRGLVPVRHARPVLVPLAPLTEVANLFDENLEAAIRALDLRCGDDWEKWNISIPDRAREHRREKGLFWINYWREFTAPIACHIQEITTAALAGRGQQSQWGSLARCLADVQIWFKKSADGRRFKRLIDEAYCRHHDFSNTGVSLDSVRTYFICARGSTSHLWRHAREVVGSLQKMLVILDEGMDVWTLDYRYSELAIVYGEQAYATSKVWEQCEDYGARDPNPYGDRERRCKVAWFARRPALDNSLRFRRLGEVVDAQDECEADVMQTLLRIPQLNDSALVVCEYLFAKHVLWKRG